MRERVGFVMPLTTGESRADCSLCDWSITKPTVEDATKSIRGHVAIVHPVPIAIYRDEAPS